MTLKKSLADGLWNGQFSDMLIETTLMRFEKSHGGLTDSTTDPNTVKTWAFSMHDCGKIDLALQTFLDREKLKDKYSHREESTSRIDYNSKDKEKN